MLRANKSILLWGSWIAIVALSIFTICNYEFTPGQVGSVPPRWTTDLGLKQPTAPHPTLLVSLHPKCSCSQATLALLSDLFATSDTKANVVVLVTKPANKTADWKNDIDLLTFRIQSELDGQVMIDIDSVNSKRFGMLTSGHILAYAVDGSLLYSGGITTARGARSNGPGFDALKKIVTLANRTQEKLENKPVFGCELTNA